jgi:RecQ family ATP-dependent DNA helicase
MSITEKLDEQLFRYFGFREFRPLQEDIVQSIVEGKDCLAILPTGGGKSLCYQLPGLVRKDITIVISPLISLMTDQVEHLVRKSLSAVTFHSGLSQAERKKLLEYVQKQSQVFVYISPETLQSEWFSEFAQKLKISLVVVDEAHCISEWGHQFRPEYRQVSDAVKRYKHRPPIAAFTASATPKVAQDIVDQLGLQSPALFRQSVLRTNLSLRILECPSNTMQYIVLQRLLEKHQKQPMLLYCATRSQTEHFAHLVAKLGYQTAAYHAGLSTQERAKIQQQYLNDEVQVICATTAFGMGVDKPNIGCVIHLSLPVSLEGYYQEVGRAGRAGAPSNCYLLTLPTDKSLQEDIITSHYPPIKICDQFLSVLQIQPSSTFNLNTLISKIPDALDNRALFQNVLQYGEKNEWWQVNRLTKKLSLTKSKQDIFGIWKNLRQHCFRQLQKLHQMANFCQTPRCRMQQLLLHFEPKEHRPTWQTFRCKNCDICYPQIIARPTATEQKKFRTLFKHYQHPAYSVLENSLLRNVTLQLQAIVETKNFQQLRQLPGIGRGWRQEITKAQQKIFSVRGAPQVQNDLDQNQLIVLNPTSSATEFQSKSDQTAAHQLAPPLTFPASSLSPNK